METSTSSSSSHQPPKRTKVMESEQRVKAPPPQPAIQLLIPSLPDELSLEIITRLPIKPLIKFTTVSKSWNSLINSPNFTKSHISASLSNPLHPHHYLLHSCARPYFTLHQTPFPAILHDPVIVPREITHPMRHLHESLWLVGSINGLVCLALIGREIIFWNPSLGKHRRVPRLEVNFEGGYSLFGFGYDGVGEDYKVVAIFCVFKESNLYGNEVMVYSRKRDSWKRIQGFKEGVPLIDSGKFVNGKLHWVTSTCFDLSSGSRCKWNIVSIHVGDESWGELDQPNYTEGKYDFELGVMGEWICVLCNNGQCNVDFWVMKEYGVRESWTKFASITFSNVPERDSYQPPLCFSNNGKILLKYGTNLVLYDSKDDSQTNLEISDFNACIEALVYVESLVLP